MSVGGTLRSPEPIDLEHERAVLDRARAAVETKLARLTQLKVGGADSFADEYIAAIVAGTVEKLTNELVVFGRIDDDQAWRIGLYGIDDGSDQLVVDWRAPFAAAFYQASFDEPLGLDRRVSYVGSITDLLIEEFATGEVAGSSPLMAELSRSRGVEMRTAVATLQSDQDALVRLDPEEKLVLRGGPGTGKTVVGLHRAAWLVYSDTRVTADRLLVIGPSDRFLRYVASVLPTLGEARIHQTTFERFLGPATEAGSDEAWIAALDQLEEQMIRPAEFMVGARTVPEADVVEAAERVSRVNLPWKDRRKLFVDRLARERRMDPKEVGRAAAEVFPAVTMDRALRLLRRESTLREIGMDEALIERWLATDVTVDRFDGPLADEVRARFVGAPVKYSHVIVDEAQDLSLLQLRAVLRRSKGVTMVGDDAQRSVSNSLGLRRIAALIDSDLVEMRTAYRMSAEIANWLNAHAQAHGLDAVTLDGIRPNGIEVGVITDVTAARVDLEARWGSVAVIAAGEVWQHKGVEYDAVVVDRSEMTPSEIYLAASRAAHELRLF